MSANFPLLSLIAFSPLLGVLILLFIPKNKGQLIKIIGIATTFIPLILAGILFAQYDTAEGGYQFAEQMNWINIPLDTSPFNFNPVPAYQLTFDYTMAVDGLTMPLVFLTALVAAMAALASVNVKKRWKTYFILFLLLEMGVFGVFMAKDLFLFFLFFEVTLVPMFFLVGIWGQLNRERAANKFLLYNGIGSAIMLIAFMILVATAGFTQVGDANGVTLSYSGNLDVIIHNLFSDAASAVHSVEAPFYLSNAMKTTLFVMLLIAFGIKLPFFPFHTWMLKVHTEASPAIVMIHSGLLLKMGAYGLIRFGIMLFPEQAQDWAFVLALLGLINIVYGAILAFVQKDFRLVLAYSSISHMGIVLLGLAAFNQIGMQGAIFQMVSHGLISALLFLIVGSIYERTQTTELNKLGGLSASVPFISGMLLVGGMASLGLPGLSGFISEFLAFMGLFETMKVVAAISALGIILAAVYVLRGVLKMTFGPSREEHAGLRDARLIEAVPMIILVAFIILLGVYPSILSDSLDQTIVKFDQLLQSFAMQKGV